jgi:hypothetical protein
VLRGISTQEDRSVLVPKFLNLRVVMLIGIVESGGNSIGMSDFP